MPGGPAPQDAEARPDAGARPGRGGATGRGGTDARRDAGCRRGRDEDSGAASVTGARRGGGRAVGDGHGLGGEQVEGRQAVRELLAAGRRPVREVWIAEDLDPSPQIDDIERMATRDGACGSCSSPGRKLDRAARTDAPQGVLAHARPLEEVELDALCRARRGAAPFLLVLDGVTDPHNVGALLRSAECAGVTGVVAAPPSCRPRDADGGQGGGRCHRASRHRRGARRPQRAAAAATSSG